MSEIFFPGLAVAARRLKLDSTAEAELAESVLHAMACGLDEREAMRMALRDFLQRRGLYHGHLRRLVDSGQIFSMAEGDENVDGIGNCTVRTATPARRSGAMGCGSPGTGTAAPKA